MKLDNSTYSVAELRDMLGRKDLIVNKTYQRGAGLWPSSARSYFIDTMLMGFPFPKLYFFESLDRTSRRVIREIVDGQQRITSMMDFIADKVRLTSVSRQYHGLIFSDLPEEIQMSFLSHPIPVDVVRSATKAEILEMFRRMNAYTLPLNESEKRHAQFHGPFKWFVNTITSELSATFVEFDILTNRQIVRMADAELIAEMVLTLESGVISTSPKLLHNLYARFDETFDKQREYGGLIADFFDFLTQQLTDFKGSYLMKAYTVHTLFCAFVLNKQGLPDEKGEIGLGAIGHYYNDIDTAREQLRSLSQAHESHDIEGDFKEYVLAVEGATTRKPSRLKRIQFLAKALRGELIA
ncbi:MAG: DUF262 domain-containing protein [Pseudomonadota bacterium]